MIVAELPIDEEERLIDLASYDIMDSLPEDEFDELVELAGKISNCPISLITLIDKNRQWFKAKRGLVAESTSRDSAFCAHAILQDDVLKVEDATKDFRFEGNPLVTGDLNIRFYAGAPIFSPGGHKLGTLCIIDKKPKIINSFEERALVILANQVTKLLELRAKNKLIRKRAEEIIAMKTDSINKVLQMQEDGIRSIAMNLHENLAQSVASSIMYVDTASEKPENSSVLLQKAKSQLQEVLVSMRDLSNQIMPASLNTISMVELIKDYIFQIAETYPFTISFKTGEVNKEFGNDYTLIVIRIIEQWLKILINRKKVSRVYIFVQIINDLELHIDDNGTTDNFEEIKKEIFDSLIYNRVQSLGGIIDLSISPLGNNIFKITIPS